MKAVFIRIMSDVDIDNFDFGSAGAFLQPRCCCPPSGPFPLNPLLFHIVSKWMSGTL